MPFDELDIKPPPRGSLLTGFLLVVLCLAVYLPGFFSIPVVDRDEARFAQASRQMFQSGDYTVPKIQGRPRLNKPPLIYWLEAVSAKTLSGDNPWTDAIWMYRLPSLLAAIAAVLATWRLGRSMFSPTVGWLGAAILAASPIMFWESHQARADMLLLACTTVAVWMLWEIWKRETEKRKDQVATDYTAPPPSSVPPFLLSFLLWLAIAAGVLTKGPITLMVIGLGTLALSLATRRYRWIWKLQPILGLLLVAATLGPWVYLVSRQVGWDTYIHTIRDEVLGRSLDPKEGHGGYPGYHTLLMPCLLFPGSLLIGVGLWRTWKDALAARANIASVNPASLFLLCLILPSWLLFELIGTKLPHYTMPLYPALALIAARALCIDAPAFLDLFKSRFLSIILTTWLITISLAILASGLLHGVTLPTPLRFAALAAITLLCLALFIFGAVKAISAQNLPRLMIVGLLGWAVVTTNTSAALPRIDVFWVSRSLARGLDTIDPDHKRDLAAIGYQEDSLIYLTRGRIERIDAADRDQWLAQHPKGLLVVTADLEYNMPKWLPLMGVDGFNYTKGREVVVAIVERLK